MQGAIAEDAQGPKALAVLTGPALSREAGAGSDESVQRESAAKSNQ